MKNPRPADNSMLNRFSPALAAVVLAMIAALAAPLNAANRWEGRIQRYEAADRENPPPRNAVLFLGSSSIAGWNTRRFFPGIETINRGFGGSRIADSVHFAERIVLPYRPRTIVFYAGDNDIAGGLTPEQVLADYRQFVGKVHAALPETRIVFVAIKPSIARWRMVEEMRLANALIEAETKRDPRLAYVDVDTPMIGPDGQPRKGLFKSDGLHLNRQGYELWTQWVLPYITVPVEDDSGDGAYPLLGTVDLGPGRHCEVFSSQGDSATAVLWQSRPGPPPQPVEQLGATNPAGKALEPPADAPYVACYRLQRLPVGWREQCRVEWLTPTILRAFPGSTLGARLRAPDGVTVDWEDPGDDLSVKLAELSGDRVRLDLRISVDARVGSHPLVVVVKGDGWRKTLRSEVRVSPSLVIDAEPYLPGRPAAIRLFLQDPSVSSATLAAPEASGRIEPATVRFDSGRAEASFYPKGELQSAVEMSILLPSGIAQRLRLRPGWAVAPGAGGLAADGRLEDWPETASLPADVLVSTDESFRPEVSFAWAPEGLWVAWRLPVEDLVPGTPDRWWRGSCLELFVDASDAPADGWPASSHQFYFLPLQGPDGDWRLACGEWKRGEAIDAAVFEDERCSAALSKRAHGYAAEAFLPTTALGAAPRAGDHWRIGLSIQLRDLKGVIKTAHWPRAKERGLLQGAASWGVIRLRPGEQEAKPQK